MKDFIGGIEPIVFMNQDDALPPEPAPPGPYDRELPALDSLKTGSLVYGLEHGCLIVRIIARNGANALPALSMTANGAAPTYTHTTADAIAGHPLAHVSAWKGLAPGNVTIAWSCAGAGTAGLAAMRIGDVVTFDSVGTVVEFLAPEGLVDIGWAPQAPGNGDLSYQAGFVDERAYPIVQYYGAIEQWQTMQFQLGAEEVTNGAFDSAAGWNVTAGWSIAGGLCTRGAYSTMDTQIRQAKALTVGARYLNQFDIPSMAGGGKINFIWPMVVGHNPVGTVRTAPGHYQQVVTVPAGTGNNLVNGWGFKGTKDTTAAGSSVDNFSMRKIQGGLTAWFAREVTPGAGQLTIEANNYNDNPWGVGLLVEFKGLVLP